MADYAPKIVGRSLTPVSPWMTIVAREVEFAPGEKPQTYHAVAQLDYIAIVAVTLDGHIPVVRQFRPALEQFTWELPAGLVDAGEDPAETCRRELHEETGYVARSVQPLGTTAPCSGRLSNRLHSFFVATGERDPSFTPEPGVEPALVTTDELARMIKAGEFISQLHLGTLLLAELNGLIALPR